MCLQSQHWGDRRTPDACWPAHLLNQQVPDSVRNLISTNKIQGIEKCIQHYFPPPHMCTHKHIHMNAYMCIQPHTPTHNVLYSSMDVRHFLILYNSKLLPQSHRASLSATLERAWASWITSTFPGQPCSFRTLGQKSINCSVAGVSQPCIHLQREEIYINHTGGPEWRHT